MLLRQENLPPIPNPKIMSSTVHILRYKWKIHGHPHMLEETPTTKSMVIILQKLYRNSKMHTNVRDEEISLVDLNSLAGCKCCEEILHNVRACLQPLLAT